MPSSKPAKPMNRHLWLVEPLESDPAYLIKSMFGGKSVYLEGRLVLFLADKDEPWRGVLIPMERDQHAALIADLLTLTPHPVLPKWLYLPETADSFEADAQWLVQQIRRRDPRIGVVPPPSKKETRAQRFQSLN